MKPRILIETRCADDTWTKFLVQLTERPDDIVRITVGGPLREAMSKIQPEIEYWAKQPQFNRAQ